MSKWTLIVSLLACCAPAQAFDLGEFRLLDRFNTDLYFDGVERQFGFSGYVDLVSRGQVSVIAGLAHRDERIWGGTASWSKWLAGVAAGSDQVEFDLFGLKVHPKVTLTVAHDTGPAGRLTYGGSVRLATTRLEDVVSWLSRLIEGR